MADAKAGAPIAVMVVDDSAVIRGVLTRWLEEDPAIKVVASAANGQIAVRLIKQQPVDVVILDIEMPEMDGMTALPLLLDARPQVQVIMASTLTLRNADISLKALGLGAVDYIPKPQNTKLVSGFDFRRELIEKVKTFGTAGRARGDRLGAAAVSAAPVARPVVRPLVRPVDVVPAAAAERPKLDIQPISLSPQTKRKPAILAIGSSTGGPQALFKLLGGLARPFPLPIVITQHMPATFTTILAQHIEKATGLPSKEAEEGDSLRPGHVYIAPGDWHMTVCGGSNSPKIVLDQSPPVNFCRPAVDPLFSSLAKTFGPAVLGVVLTGMGSDGRTGAGAIVKAGGSVIVQDAATSVVWGMPGAVANAGFAAAVLPLEELAPCVTKIMTGVGV